jgi:hypothetical protein
MQSVSKYLEQLAVQESIEDEKRIEQWNYGEISI